MKKFITDERTGLHYELVGDYYLIAGEDEPEQEQEPIGIWGQQHLRYLKEHHRVRYANLLTSGELNAHSEEKRCPSDLYQRKHFRWAGGHYSGVYAGGICRILFCRACSKDSARPKGERNQVYE